MQTTFYCDPCRTERRLPENGFKRDGTCNGCGSWLPCTEFETVSAVKVKIAPVADELFKAMEAKLKDVELQRSTAVAALDKLSVEHEALIVEHEKVLAYNTNLIAQIEGKPLVLPSDIDEPSSGAVDVVVKK